MPLQLRPALLRARRGPGELQVGADPERGVVLHGVGAAEERLLAEVDGTHDVEELVRRGTALGVPAPRTRRLLAVLEGAGLLVTGRPDPTSAVRPPRRTAAEQRSLSPDARVLGLTHPDGDGWGLLGHRWRSAVHVVGGTRTGLAVALGLAGAGVGRVVVADGAPVVLDDLSPGGYRLDDLGRTRAARAALLLRARCPLVLTEPSPLGLAPDAFVLVAHGAAAPGAGDELGGAPHLVVLRREGTAVVGPLVRPGASACLRCLDRHRTDRDPGWPGVAEQLAAAPGQPEETSLTAVAAALAVAQVLAQLDGVARPAALGASLEVSLPVSGVVARRWNPHPGCGCTASHASDEPTGVAADGLDGGPPGRAGRAADDAPRRATPVSGGRMRR